MKTITELVVLFFLFSGEVFSQAGRITGLVSDAKTGEPLIGVNVVINELKSVGASTNESGRFRIVAPVGSYSLKASLLGYKAVVKTDIIVTTGGETHVVMKMMETPLELGQVTVTPDYFDKAAIENTMSTVVLGAEEVRRSPGSDQDFQRILQAMAGVSFSTDQTNELLVRGGAPDENLTVLDHMEIHSTNHYPNQYNSGGPINMINVDLIQDVQFSTGGFISKYGDKSSSVMSITTREGTRENLISGSANLSMAGYGAVLEGRINGSAGSWLVSARKSYVDLIAGSFGLTAIPKYYDLQSKAVYDLSRLHKLSFSGIYGNDLINIQGEPNAVNLSLAGKNDTVDVYNVDVRQHQYTAGLTLESKWSDRFVSIVTVSRNNYHDGTFVTSDFTERHFGSTGKVNAVNILYSRDIYRQSADNGETSVNSEFIWNLDKNNEMNFGGAVKFIDFKSLESVDADTARYDLNGDGDFDATITVPASRIDYNFPFPEQHKAYSYVNDKVRIFGERLVLNVGVRYDYMSYSGNGDFSPRFSASYSVVPERVALNLSLGKFFQTPALPYFGDRFQTEVNRYLESAEADHYVIGVEYLPAPGLKVDVEGYYKKYTRLPVSETFVHFFDRTFRSERTLNIGRQDVYGLDLLVQQKLVKDIYGTLAFSRMETRYYDPRIGMEGKTFPSDYDFPYVVTAIFGKRFAGLRSTLNEMPFYLKYPSYILPFSDDMEISFRYRYATGKPYTPQVFVTSEQHREGASKWSSGWWAATDNINSARYPDYQRFDLAFSSRFNFEAWNLVMFLSVQNVLNRKNVAFYQYNSDGTVETVYQFAILPVVGMEVEF
ncbi:MAG: TonB-dependent receptor [Bacteroidetes bacterium]|nr:TonB-dependent receptor [Bacteroidota bacterium]MCL5266796.1 TonB-dependent receptor [Bacteroidota bacterium]